MKRKVLAIMLVCSILGSMVACGKDTDNKSNTTQTQNEENLDESIPYLTAESSVSIEVGADEEGGLVS